MQVDMQLNSGLYVRQKTVYSVRYCETVILIGKWL